MNTKKKAVRLTKFERTKKWDYFSVKSLLKKNQETGSMDKRHSSGRSRNVSTEGNMYLIEEFGCSQEKRSHTHLAPRKIAKKQESVGHQYGEW